MKRFWDAITGSIGRMTARPGFWLFIAVVCLNLASMSREVPWGDARPVFEVAVSMVHGDGVAAQTRWPSDAAPGKDGRFYAAQPWLPSLLHLPGAAVRALLGHLSPRPELAHLFDAFSSHLAGSLLGAFVVWLFFRLCLRHGASPKVAGLTAMMLALASIVWVYARYPFTEIVQIACFTGFFFALTELARQLDRRTALATGLWAGMLLNSKYIYALCLPGAFLLVVIQHRKSVRELGRAIAWVLAGILPGVAMILLYNYLRFGSIAKTGYSNVAGVMVENPLLSLWGFLFSPGKSIFLYTPPLVLAVFGLPRFWRSQRTSVLAMVLTIVPVMLFYARFPAWPGDWAWGPRYAVFAVPVLLLPAVGFLSGLRWPGRSVAAFIFVVGICVQLLGNAFYWDHYLRIALDVRGKWLGQPNRTASLTHDKGGFCEGCFEDVYPTVWLGPLQPILGHWWLLRHVPFHDDWREAEQNAPWRRHTHLDIDIRATYERVRVDHWIYDTHQHRTAGWIVLVLLCGGSEVGWLGFWRRSRDTSSCC